MRSSYGWTGAATAQLGPTTRSGFRYAIKSYALLDLRASIGAADDAWRLSIFGRNVTNTLVVNTIFAGSDSVWRQVGMPTTYGATVSFKLR